MTIYQNSEKLETVAMETGKSWFVDFWRLFDPERPGYSHQIILKLKWYGHIIFWQNQIDLSGPSFHSNSEMWVYMCKRTKELLTFPKLL